MCDKNYPGCQIVTLDKIVGEIYDDTWMEESESRKVIRIERVKRKSSCNVRSSVAVDMDG